MKTMPNPINKILNMKASKVEIDKNIDIYHRYQRLKKMLNVYDRQQRSKNITNLLKINDPTISLGNFFKIEGLDPKEDIDDYRIYKKMFDVTIEENPEIQLADVTSKDTRNLLADIMNQLDKNKQISTKDLEFIAVIEGYGLYNAIAEIEKGEEREAVKMKYGLVEEMLQKGEKRKARFDNTVAKTAFDCINKDDENNCTYLIAAVLEIGIGDASQTFTNFDKKLIRKREEKTEITDECLLVNPKKPDFYVIESYTKSIDNYVPSQENTARVKNLVNSYLAKINKYNEERENEERIYRQKHGGRPSPLFIKELEEYKRQKNKKQESIKRRNEEQREA